MLREFAENPEQLWMLLVRISAFGLVIGLWFAVMVIWYQRRAKREQQLEARLGIPRPGSDGGERVLRLWHGSGAAETVVPLGHKPTLFERMEQTRRNAGWNTSIPLAIVYVLFAAILSLVGSYLLLKNPLPGLVLAVLIVIAFYAYLSHCLAKRIALFERQLVEALELGGRSLRAGHPLSGAFRLIAEEIPAPIGTVFSEIVEQESLGVAMHDSLRQAADKSHSADMRIFAVSVIIQLRSGGNLADMMERVGWVIRERMRLHRKARVLAAEAQLSKWVLLGLPSALFVVLNILNPTYMKPFFTDWRGQIMILVCLAMMTVGGLVMNWMAKLKY